MKFLILSVLLGLILNAGLVQADTVTDVKGLLEKQLGRVLEQAEVDGLSVALAPFTQEKTYILACGGGMGGLAIVGAQAQLCTDLGGQGYWTAGGTLGLVGGGAAQFGVIVIGAPNGDPTGQYFGLEGGSALGWFGLAINYSMSPNGNIMGRFLYTPGVMVDGGVSTTFINKF